MRRQQQATWEAMARTAEWMIRDAESTGEGYDEQAARNAVDALEAVLLRNLRTTHHAMCAAAAAFYRHSNALQDELHMGTGAGLGELYHDPDAVDIEF